MKITFISLFNEMFEGYLASSMMRKAQEIGAVQFELLDLRRFGRGPRSQIDDTPYGGGDGMLLMVEPLVEAIEHARASSELLSKVLLMTPRGETFDQGLANKLAAQPDQHLIFISGRYEGYDERVTEFVDQEISIGDFVLTGGELPALMISDAIVRLLPGVLGGQESVAIESFMDDEGTVEFPQYTRPAEFRGMRVPDVLLSGNHGEIDSWRQSMRQKKD